MSNEGKVDAVPAASRDCCSALRTAVCTGRSPPGLGSIEGQVVDASSGEPIAKATVIAEPDDPPAAGKLAHTLADDGGKFFLDLALDRM